MNKQTIHLIDRQRKQYAYECILKAPEDHVCTIQKKTRTLDQNAILHAALTDISKQVLWHGNKLSVDIWKRLCVAAWLREKGEQPMLIPALDGSGVDVIYEKTSRLNVSQCSELVEWCFSFGAEHEVIWSE